MGTFIYNGSMEATSDDRRLAHLEKVILAKLRRHEAFSFSWDEPGSSCTVWLERAVPIAFRYDKVGHEINRHWLDALMESANSGAGLREVGEPEPVPSARSSPRPGSAG